MLQSYIDRIINTALEEDISYLDITTDNLFSETHTSESFYIAKDSGILCGIDVALRVFEILGGVKTEKLFSDGAEIKNGDILAKMSGKTCSLLKGERTALNLIQHMSGVATLTNKCVKLAEGKALITDTRKTLPGIRALQKYAVTVGGGKNHRFNLSDGAMLKDNHIDACGSITNAMTALRGKIGHMVKIEVEVRNLTQMWEALNCKADIILLDNMSIEDMAEAVHVAGGKAMLEASGNVTLENIAEISKTGVDIISMGALTHSAKAFDISMKFIKK